MFFEIQTCNGLFRSQGSLLRIADQKLYLLSQLLFCLIVNIIEINAVYRGCVWPAFSTTYFEPAVTEKPR